MQLREMRLKAGYKQREVAEYLGVTRLSVARWEQGRYEPDLKTIQRLSEIYRCSINELFGIANPTPTPPETITAGEELKAS